MLSTSTLNSIQPSYIRDILKVASSSDVISFAGGLPDQGSFPISLMKPIFREFEQRSDLFQYSQTQGYQPLIDELKGIYNISTANDLMISSGSQQGLDLIARAFIEPGDKVLVESPCYLGALQVFELSQAELLSVDQIDNKIDFEQMEFLLKNNDVTFFYFVADFQNPTGICYDLKTRKKIAQLCKQYSVTMIEDAPYRELRFEGEDLPLVSSFNPEHSIILRSFSKLVSPGVRIASIEGPANIIKDLVKLKQIADLHSNVPSQYLVLQLLKNPLFKGHLLEVKSSYKDKKTLMIEHLKKELGQYINVENVEGGMFLWVEILSDRSIDMLQLAEIALTKGVAIVPGQVFNINIGENQPFMRLNFSHSTHDEIILGVSILADVIKQIINKI